MEPDLLKKGAFCDGADSDALIQAISRNPPAPASTAGAKRKAPDGGQQGSSQVPFAQAALLA